MIVYGTRSSSLSSDIPEELVCPNCENKGTTRITVLGRYVHIFWIPLFPAGRPAVSECGQCQASYEKNGMTPEMREATDRLSSSSKTPLWFFSGLAIIALLIGYGAFLDYQNSSQNEQYISEPMAGDRYEYVSGEKLYSILKVVEVDTDSVYVIENSMQVDKKSGISSIDLQEYYPDPAFGLSREEVKNMWETEVIYDVDRD